MKAQFERTSSTGQSAGPGQVPEFPVNAKYGQTLLNIIRYVLAHITYQYNILSQHITSHHMISRVLSFVSSFRFRCRRCVFEISIPLGSAGAR